jgi:hypothetical protein
MANRSKNEVSYFANTTFRRSFRPFGIRQSDRLSHLYVLGKTGVGKSSLIETLALQDAGAHRGFALIDPHGDLAERVRDALTKSPNRPFLYLDAADGEQPYGYNPLRRVRDDIGRAKVEAVKILFVHHSIGRHCLEAGLRNELLHRFPGTDIWDIDYRKYGVHGPDGETTVVPGLIVPNDNTNPDGLNNFVVDFLTGAAPGLNASSNFDILIFKSCYTGARVRSEAQLTEYIDAGLSALTSLRAANYPAVILTPVPDSPLRSSRKMAERAKRYAETMVAAGSGSSKIRVCNLHALMGDSEGHLLPRFRRWGGFDPHPNSYGLRNLNKSIIEAVSAIYDEINAASTLADSILEP